MNSSRTLVKVAAFILLFLGIGEVKAQEPVYSQYFNNPIYYNPANIGANPGLRARLQYRDQWKGIKGDLKNYNFSMDIAERNIPGSGGLGLIVNRERLGVGFIERTTVGLGTSVRIRLQENFIAQVGIMGKYVQSDLSEDLVFTGDLHETLGYVGNSGFVNNGSFQKNYPDLNLGGLIRYHGSTYKGDILIGTIGASVHHLFKPDVSFIGATSKLARNYIIHGDLLIDKNGGSGYSKSKAPRIKINPGFIFETQSSEFVNFMGGVNVMRSNLYLGAWYRSTSYGDFMQSNDIIFMAGLYTNFADNAKLKIMYSYDYNVSELGGVIGSTHEISLMIEFDDLFMFGAPTRVLGGKRTTRNAAPLECSPF